MHKAQQNKAFLGVWSSFFDGPTPALADRDFRSIDLPQIEAKTVERLMEAGYRSRAFRIWRREATGQRDHLGRRKTVERSAPCSRAHHFTLPLDTNRREYQDCKESLDIIRRNENQMETLDDQGLEAYEVLADGRSFVRSDHERRKGGTYPTLASLTGTRRIQKKQAHLRAWHALA
jgi:hypothetical protein